MDFATGISFELHKSLYTYLLPLLEDLQIQLRLGLSERDLGAYSPIVPSTAFKAKTS